MLVFIQEEVPENSSATRLHSILMKRGPVPPKFVDVPEKSVGQVAVWLFGRLMAVKDFF